MEIILAYLSVFALLAAVAGLFIPHKLVFWVGPDDRTRAMAFSVYLTAAVILAVTFIVVVPEPQPMPAVEDVVEIAPPAPLTEPIFLKEVSARLAKVKGFKMDDMRFSLLDFGPTGATVQLKFAKKPHRKIAVEHATETVKAMVEVFKAHDWKLGPAMLLECQVHTDEIIYTGGKGHRSMGFARYQPDTGKVSWLDFNG